MSQSVRTSKGMIYFLKLNLLFEYQNLNRMKGKNQGTFILILHISYMFRDSLVGSARHVIEDYEFEARCQPYFAVYSNDILCMVNPSWIQSPRDLNCQAPCYLTRPETCSQDQEQNPNYALALGVQSFWGLWQYPFTECAMPFSWTRQ